MIRLQNFVLTKMSFGVMERSVSIVTIHFIFSSSFFVFICDQICENVHIVHASIFSTFKYHKICNEQQIDLKLAWVYTSTIPLSSLQIVNLYAAPTRFYESLNEQNRMCELYTYVCMFSQIQLHTYIKQLIVL